MRVNSADAKDENISFIIVTENPEVQGRVTA